MPSCDKEKEYTLVIEVNPSVGGTANPAVGSHDYDDGTEVNVTATPADGYVFDHWSGDAEETTTSVSIAMTSNKSVTANFALTYDLTVNVEPVEAGEVTLSEEGPYKEDMEVTLTATPAVGYVFDHWSGAVSGDTNPVTITMDSDKTVTAHYLATLTVEVRPPYGGTVQIDTPTDSYGPDNVVTLTAEPGTEVTLTVYLKLDRFSFLYWEMDTDQILGEEESITITIDSAMKIIAEVDCGDG